MSGQIRHTYTSILRESKATEIRRKDRVKEESERSMGSSASVDKEKKPATSARSGNDEDKRKSVPVCTERGLSKTPNTPTDEESKSSKTKKSVAASEPSSNINTKSTELNHSKENVDTPSTGQTSNKTSSLLHDKENDLYANRREKPDSDSVTVKQTCKSKTKPKDVPKPLKTASSQQQGYQVQVARRDCDNLNFYQNKLRSKPLPGYTIEDMLRWKGDYRMLETNHRYIQWLFPIPEGSGMNPSAQPLMDHEIQKMKEDETVQKRILKAYIMMLDFYGMKLEDPNFGNVRRSDKWKERFEHLNRSGHNRMRITRILKSLGELGYDRFQAPWINFLIKESVETMELWALNGPCMGHWIGAVKDPAEQEVLYKRWNCLFVPNSGVSNDAAMENSESEEESDGNTHENEELGEPTNTNDNRVEFRVTVEADSDMPDTLPNNCLKRPVMKQEVNTESVETSNPILPSSDSERLDYSNVKNPGPKTASPFQNNNDTSLPSENLQFYQDKILSKPAPGFSIETFLKHKGDHCFFDEYPSFIQWLFPIPYESTWNLSCQPLKEHEAKAIREDSKMSRRVMQAYETFLDYLGMQLEDENFGTIKPLPDSFERRFKIMNEHPDNYRRITRMLTSLGELGYERFQVPFIEFLITQGVDNAHLPSLQGEDILHWLNAIKDDEEKSAMFRKYQSLAALKERPEIESGVEHIKLDRERTSGEMGLNYNATLSEQKMKKEKHGIPRAFYKERVNPLEMQMDFEVSTQVPMDIDDQAYFEADIHFV